MLGSAKTNLPLLTLTCWVNGTSPFVYVVRDGNFDALLYVNVWENIRRSKIIWAGRPPNLTLPVRNIKHSGRLPQSKYFKKGLKGLRILDWGIGWLLLFNFVCSDLIGGKAIFPFPPSFSLIMALVSRHCSSYVFLLQLNPIYMKRKT